nr:putative reverse transcriptase domain-containing protein [Tanacetum cinerariifolium]
MAPFEMLYERKCLSPLCWNEVGEEIIEGPELVRITNEKVDVSPWKGVQRFGIKRKLSPRFIGPFEVLEKVGDVAYRLALPPALSHVQNVFHVSTLRGYNYHLLHVVEYPLENIRENLSCEEEAKAILAHEERIMRRKTIPFVKVLWKIILNVRLLGNSRNLFVSDTCEFLFRGLLWHAFVDGSYKARDVVNRLPMKNQNKEKVGRNKNN